MKETKIESISEIPVTALAGIGAYRAKALALVGVRTVYDLLMYVPRRYLDRSAIVPMTELHKHVDSVVTVIGRVSGIVMMGRGRKRLVVTLRDVRGSMDIVFFQGLQYWQKAFQQDEALAVSGVVAFFGPRPNMVHPDVDRLQDEDTLEFINTGGIVPVYPSGAELEKVGLNRHGGFRRLIVTALQRYLDQVPDPLDGTPMTEGVEVKPAAVPRAASILERRKLLPLREAVGTIHRPKTREALDGARRRLAFDEFFLLSLQLAWRRRKYRITESGISFRVESPTARALVQALPFALTAAQKRVIREITGDMARPEPMNRLLQGDVGSGKTVVALLAMLVAVDNGYQCALMVPTEILAEQHYRTIASLVNDLRLDVRLLTGQQSRSQHAEIVAGIAGGSVNIAVGTHALIQEGVEFSRLGFVVIDEQHRFGVMQRAGLRGKGCAPDVLVMTATPIPRTLSMTLYGDLNVSVIDEMPAGRKRIRTALRFEEDRDQILAFLEDEIRKGGQAYIVFPLVTESEKIDLKAATEEYEKLSRDVFPAFRFGLLHGRMPPKEKDEVMMRFLRKEIDVLVSTTVIEVGVDVPNAAVMIVEHAERFGLAQLHQLRGRIGRGDRQGTCILMTEKRILYAAKKKTEEEQKAFSDTRRRLETMRDHLDGFKIAEIDMEIRGPGDLWGTQQSGFPEFRVANLLLDGDILREAREEAFRIIETDPQLRLPEHERIRAILGPVLRSRMGIADIA